ncbi:dynein axonemal heavy chain 3-like [Anopheles moucheti]|uniref:dynein axonemal heavy chain 3-like n=1 Tax=Anopheles moucheti TaxID=186751 RepID=UPI0022F1142D|nr:dynein axonemal heavy chain 3-like [Anopheles moucheti]
MWVISQGPPIITSYCDVVTPHQPPTEKRSVLCVISEPNQRNEKDVNLLWTLLGSLYRTVEGYDIDAVLNFEKDDIPLKVIQKLEERVFTNENFDPEKVKAASAAAEGLCKWVIAIAKYNKVAKEIAPKKAALAEAQASYNSAMTILNAKLEQLRIVEENLADLQRKLDEQIAQHAKLQANVELCMKKLERATEIITGLGGEKDRWQTAAETLALIYDTLTGDVLIASGIVAYLGPFTMQFRAQQIEQWIERISQN